MDYQTVPIEKVRPDPGQPRRYFNEDSLKEMAVSIKNEGLINPIEVDEHYIIITGERRWRSSKIAGCKEIAVKVITGLPAKERFIRQVQENIHQNTMSAWDTAEALEKIRKWVSSSAGELDRDAKHKSNRYQRGVSELHDLLGIPESTISEHLDLLGFTGELKKALQDPKFSRTKVRGLKDLPEKYKKGFEKVIAKQTDIPRDTADHLATALKRADRYGEHDAAERLLKENYEGMTTTEALSKINKIVPDENARVKEPADAAKVISERVIAFMELLDEYPLESFDLFHGSLVAKDLQGLGFRLMTYLKDGKKMLLK